MPQVRGAANWLTNVRQPIPVSCKLQCDASSARIQNEHLDRAVELELDRIHSIQHRQLADRMYEIQQTKRALENYERLRNIVQSNNTPNAVSPCRSRMSTARAIKHNEQNNESTDEKKYHRKNDESDFSESEDVRIVPRSAKCKSAHKKVTYIKPPTKGFCTEGNDNEIVSNTIILNDKNSNSCRPKSHKSHNSNHNDKTDTESIKSKLRRRRFLLVASGTSLAKDSSNQPQTSTNPHQNISPLRPKTAINSQLSIEADSDSETRDMSPTRILSLTELPKHKQRRSRREIYATVQHHDNPRLARPKTTSSLFQPKVSGRSFQELKNLTHVDHLNEAEKQEAIEKARLERQEALQEETMKIQEKIHVFYVKLEKLKKPDKPQRRLTVLTANLNT